LINFLGQCESSDSDLTLTIFVDKAKFALVNEEFFELQHVNVWRGENCVLRDFSLTLRRGESVAILGPNGSGKSTLVQLITGDLAAEFSHERVCRLFGEELWSLEDLRHKIGFVAPEQARHFDDDETTMDIVLSALRGANGRTREMRFSAHEKEAARAAMEITGVTLLAERVIGTLSSGEKRRLLIARALVHQPEVLVMDEPTTALDFAGAQQLMQALRHAMASGCTVILVTHHPEEIAPEIGRVILLKDGAVLADGAKRKVLHAAGLSALYEIPIEVYWRQGWCHAKAGMKS
jgi:iron complex transport system ATP-binding protein